MIDMTIFFRKIDLINLMSWFLLVSWCLNMILVCILYWYHLFTWSVLIISPLCMQFTHMVSIYFKKIQYDLLQRWLAVAVVTLQWRSPQIWVLWPKHLNYSLPCLWPEVTWMVDSHILLLIDPQDVGYNLPVQDYTCGSICPLILIIALLGGG